MQDIWKNDNNYYKEIIDGEECYCRDFTKEYQLEISCWKKKKICLYMWKNKNEIVGKIFDLPKELFKNYENILIEECIKNGNKEYYLDWRSE